MDVEDLVQRYIRAWNQKDPRALLELMHQGGTYYDGFWMEYCSGKDLERYLEDTFIEEDYSYTLIGEVLVVDDDIVFRYSARDQTGAEVYQGAEVLSISDNKIVTVSDFYCNPTHAALVEVARMATRRHGLTRYATMGLGEFAVSRFRNQLSDVLARDLPYLDSALTLTDLADQVGCSVNRLSQVIRSEFHTNFDGLMDQYRATFAKNLLLEESEDPDYLGRVAHRSGFRSLDQFNSSFVESFGMTPADFRRIKLKRPERNNGANSH